MARKRGHHEDSDLKFLLEKNKALERKIRSLAKENSQLKKERSRHASEIQTESEEPEKQSVKTSYKPIEVVSTETCSFCGSSEVKSFDLEVRNIKYKATACSSCGKRNRVKK